MSDKTAIVGGGPAGLAAGRALKALGLPFDIIEGNADFGGLWNRDWALSPIYDSAHFISSRTMSAFDGFPMPEEWPDYPRHDLILDYIRSFARAFGLYEHARFGAAVSSARPAPGGWRVETADGRAEIYRFLICASGATWDAAAPAIPGEFAGRLRHARDYRGAEEFAGRRVLVVGCGNSGADIACDAAQRAAFAAISLRRGYWFIPKHFAGMPTDVYAARQPKVPLRLRQFVLKRRLRRMIGDMARLGLPEPDHELLETHPLMNDQVLHHLRHGDLVVRPDVARFEGDEVMFRDGTREAFDDVVLATGYNWSLPYLADAENPFACGKAQLPLCVFSPARDDLFFMSFIKAAGSSITLFGEMSWIVARAIRAAQDGGADHAKLRAEIAANRYDLRKGLRMVASPRHEAYVNRDAYAEALRILRRRMGWPETEQNAA
ncbi:MAG: flavin-containing monooxygenase [Pikeienuella sp.]|uniref:flavin-containing monooxygenase n=1 Tax=Pikeienuella sp. TaxID=2831957 RepID=UPI003918E77A